MFLANGNMFLLNGKMFLANGYMFLVNGNIFLVNGKLFLLNGMPFINKSHINILQILKYAWCIFKATPVRNNLPNVKTYYHHIKITY